MSDKEDLWLGKPINTNIARFSAIQQPGSSDSSDSEISDQENNDHIVISDDDGEHEQSPSHHSYVEDSDYSSDEQSKETDNVSKTQTFQFQQTDKETSIYSNEEGGQVSENDEENVHSQPHQLHEEESDNSIDDQSPLYSDEEPSPMETQPSDDKWARLLKQMSNRDNVKRQTCVVTPFRHHQDDRDSNNGLGFEGIPNAALENMDPEDAAVYRGEFAPADNTDNIPQHNYESDIDDRNSLNTVSDFDNNVPEREDYEGMEVGNDQDRHEIPNNVDNINEPMEWREYDRVHNVVQERDRRRLNARRFQENNEHARNSDDLSDLRDGIQDWAEGIRTRKTRLDDRDFLGANENLRYQNDIYDLQNIVHSWLEGTGARENRRRRRHTRRNLPY